MRQQRNAPEAMWFCFFSSSVRRGLSSPAALASEAELLFGEADMLAMEETHAMGWDERNDEQCKDVGGALACWERR